jgi:hypothetical protein
MKKTIMFLRTEKKIKYKYFYPTCLFHSSSTHANHTHTHMPHAQQISMSFKSDYKKSKRKPS